MYGVKYRTVNGARKHRLVDGAGTTVPEMYVSDQAAAVLAYLDKHFKDHELLKVRTPPVQVPAQLPKHNPADKPC